METRVERRGVDMAWGSVSVLCGEPEGPPRGDILLLHGGGLDSAQLSWGDLAPRLVAAGWRVAAPDHPGFGASDPFAEPLTVARLVAYAGDLVDRLGLDRPVVGGISMGGATALGLALTRPDRVRALVLLGSYGLGSASRLADRLYWAMLRTGLLGGMWRVFHARPALVRASFGQLVQRPGDLPDDVVDELLTRAAAGEPPAWRQFQDSELTRRGPLTDYSSRLGEITAPALLVHGTADPGVPLRLARRAASLMPHARLHAVAGARHWTQRDAPDEVAAAIVGFLEGQVCSDR